MGERVLPGDPVNDIFTIGMDSVRRGDKGDRMFRQRIAFAIATDVMHLDSGSPVTAFFFAKYLLYWFDRFKRVDGSNTPIEKVMEEDENRTNLMLQSLGNRLGFADYKSRLINAGKSVAQKFYFDAAPPAKIFLSAQADTIRQAEEILGYESFSPFEQKASEALQFFRDTYQGGSL